MPCNAKPKELLNPKHLHVLCLSKADDTCCKSKHAASVLYIRTLPKGTALSALNCVETTQKESPQNQSVLWIHRREGARNTQTQPSAAPLRAAFFLEFYLRAVALAQTQKQAYLNGIAEQQPESGDDCLLEGSWTLEGGSHRGGEVRERTRECPWTGRWMGSCKSSPSTKMEKNEPFLAVIKFSIPKYLLSHPLSR